MPYYHATTLDRIESIRRHGLGGLAGAPKAEPDCLDGVYLAADPMLALGFLIERARDGKYERQHPSPREALAQFRVIVIDDSRIDKGRLSLDQNIQKDGFWLYAGVVDVSSMPVISAEEISLAFKMRSAGS